MKTILLVRGEEEYEPDTLLGFFEDTEEGLNGARALALAECVPTVGRITRFDDVRIYRAKLGESLESGTGLELLEDY